MAMRFNMTPYDLSIDQDWINVTSDRPTPNERWRFTDSQGHEHHYEHGYPTLDFVVDREHWCDGNEGIAPHDPHMHVDEGHYECKACREVIEPATDAPGTPKYIAGLTTSTLKGPRSDGSTITADLTDAEVRSIMGASDQNAEMLRVLDAIPSDRVLAVEFDSSR